MVFLFLFFGAAVAMIWLGWRNIVGGSPLTRIIPVRLGEVKADSCRLLASGSKSTKRVRPLRVCRSSHLQYGLDFGHTVVC